MKSNNAFTEFIKILNKYEYVVIYHHLYPDLDTLGAQYGLAKWICDNFSNKKVMVFNHNSNNNILAFRKYPFDNFNINEHKVLAIIVDVHQIERVDHNDTIKYCKEIAVFDHHTINLDSKYFKDNNVSYLMINKSEPATCQLLANIFFLYEKKYFFSQEAANYLFFGIITDTNRFMNGNTNKRSYEIVANFYDKKIDIYQNYLDIYKKKSSEAKLYGYIMSNFIHKNKFAYFILTDEILKKFNVDFTVGKTFVNAMKGIDNIDIFMLITVCKEIDVYSVSIRSLYKTINILASELGGGGHANACGIKIKLSEKNRLNTIIKKFEEHANN